MRLDSFFCKMFKQNVLNILIQMFRTDIVKISTGGQPNLAWDCEKCNMVRI